MKTLNPVSDMLGFAVHNRVNYFALDVLDGTWHSMCLAWKTADIAKNTSYIYVVMDGQQFSGLQTLAGTYSYKVHLFRFPVPVLNVNRNKNLHSSFFSDNNTYTVQSAQLKAYSTIYSALIFYENM